MNRVVAPDVVHAEAETLLRELTAAPPISVALSKSLITRAHETSFETSLDHQAQAQAACIESEDHREAVEAFIEKRPAHFHGR